jgi:uncharacterized protein (TIGR02284 family)
MANCEEDAMSNATTTTQAVDELNHLLRGELAAVETYDQSLPKFEEYPAAAQELRRIRDDHRETAQLLRDHVMKSGGTPSDGSGPWGGFVQAVTGTAKILGPSTTLAALKHGEEHGIKEYEQALEKPELPAECRELIRERLLVRCQEHVANLDSIRSFIG